MNREEVSIIWLASVCAPSRADSLPLRAGWRPRASLRSHDGAGRLTLSAFWSNSDELSRNLGEFIPV